MSTSEYDAVFRKYTNLIKQQACKFKIPILVNIYYIDPKYKWTENIGVGIYHSAIELFDYEIAFGYHSQEGTGVYVQRPVVTRGNMEFCFQLPMGFTKLTAEQIGNKLEALANLWKGRQYNVVSHNCHDFTNAALRVLCTDRQLPKRITRAAQMAKVLQLQNCAKPQ